MKLIDTTCPHCGSALKVDAENKNAVCEYCGANLLIDDEVQRVEHKHEFDNAEDAGYSFEKGRQRAMAEAKTGGTQPQTVYYAPVEPKKKRKTFLWVLGWICIFPIPLTILLVRKKNMKPLWKGVLIAAAWATYIIIMIAANNSEKAETPADAPHAAIVYSDDCRENA